jgi:hypothetical protein
MLSKRLCCASLLSGLALMLCGCPRQTADRVSVDANTIEAVRQVLESGVESGGSAAVALAEPTGWATVTGKFTLSGTAPANPTVTISKDAEVCRAGGTEDRVVVIGPGNGVQNVLIYISSKVPNDNPAWIHESYAAVRTAEVPFDQKNCVFLNRVGVMWASQTLKVLNSDPVGHNTKLDSTYGAKSDNLTVPAGGSVPYVPGAASTRGPFPVSCSIHPWMSASMMVCENPYFAVTGEDGSFTISNVPAGVDLEFRVWHEKPTFIKDEVSVNDKPTKWKRGAFKEKLDDGGTLTLNVVMDAAVFN